MLTVFVAPPRSAYKARRRGFNLIEAAIVLGVVGLVIGTIWVGAASMHESWKANQLYLTIQRLSIALQPFFQGGEQPDWSQRATVGPIVAEKVPGITYYDQESSTWFRSDYGFIRVFETNSGGIMSPESPYTDVISFTFEGVPRGVCLRVLSRIKAQMTAGSTDILFAGEGGDGGAYRITVPGGWMCGDSSTPCFGDDLCPESLNDIEIDLPAPR